MKTPVAPRGSDQFNLRLPDDLRDRLRAAARRSGRSMNTEIVTRLMGSLDVAPDNNGLEAKIDRILQLLESK